MVRPDSSVGRESAFGAGGCGFKSRMHHTKGVKNVTSSSFADTRIKGVVLGRQSKAGKYLLKRYCYGAFKALQSCFFQISDVKLSLFIFMVNSQTSEEFRALLI